MNLSEIVNLISNYSKDESCLLAFIFGSVAKGSSNPKDCDLFWVTIDTPDTNGWKLMKNMISEMKTDFYAKFKIKLNVSISTLDEFHEGSELKQRILERPKIIIKTAYNKGSNPIGG